jgi:hypothetical protein
MNEPDKQSTDGSKAPEIERLLQAVLDEEKTLGRSEEAGKAWEELNRAVESEPAFLPFVEMHQVIGSGAAWFEKGDLARWIVKRATLVGAQSAIADVRRYLESEDFDFSRVMLLHGLHTNREYDLGNNIRLFPAATAPVRALRESIRDPSRRSILPIFEVDSALVQSFRQRRHHCKNVEIADYPYGNEFLLARDLEHARLCFSLAGPFAPQSLGVCTAAHDDVPSKARFGWTLGEFRGPISFAFPIAPEVIERMVGFHARFAKLPRAIQDHLRIALERLNEFESTRDLARRAIALRVALEALFLKDATTELKFRLGLHAAFLVGANDHERREVFNCVKSAYDVGSKAVHTGRIDDKAAPKAFEVLKEAAAIVRKSLIALIDQPDVDFLDRILHGGLEPMEGERNE